MPLLLQFWDVIQLLDMRHVKSTDEMFEACLDHIEKANSSGVTKAFITVNISACRVLTPCEPIDLASTACMQLTHADVMINIVQVLIWLQLAC